MGAEAAKVINFEEIAAQYDYRLDLILQRIGLNSVELEKKTNAEFEAAVDAKLGELGTPGDKRSELADIMMDPLELHLAGKTYLVHPHKIHDEKKWLRALGDIAGIVAGTVGPMLGGAASGKGIDLESIDYEELLGSAVPRVIAQGVPAALELMFNYSPELAADRERITSEVPLMERAEAALKVVKLAFPSMLALLKNMLALTNVASGMAS